MNKKLVSIICAATLFSQTLPVDTIAKTIKESVINSDKSQVDAEEKNKEEDDSSTDEVKKNEKTEENNDEKSLTKPEDDFDPMEQMNKNMNMMFPVMYLFVALIAPLGLALYWLMNSLLMIIEKLVLNKLLKDEEED